MAENRRDFLKKTTLLGLTGLAGTLIGKEQIDSLESVSNTLAIGAEGFPLPALPYAYDALEPFIDKQTMEIHHGKHHKAYVEKLNSTGGAGLDMKVDDAAKCMNVDKATSALIRNNLGGHYNHSLFWQLLKPNAGAKDNKPEGKLAEAITGQFNSFDAFKKEFSDKALKIFGSGWCWLIMDNQKISITTTPNQDNPLMKVADQQGRPVLALDVWEHAYYLKYQNKRADYIANWWNIINWKKAEELFTTK